MQVPELIDAASQVTGSNYALAKELGVSQGNVNDWKHGRRSCPADLRARMAEIAGMDPGAELVAAVAEGLSEERRHGLMQAMKKARALVPVAGLLAGVGLYSAPSDANATASAPNPLNIMSNHFHGGEAPPE